MSENPLVAGKQDTTGATTGITIVEDAQSLHHGIESGSWVEGGMGAIGTAADVAMLATNPIATLTSYGLNWLIEHVQPLQDALDWVAGDPAQISAYATTWQNVSQSVQKSVQQFTGAVEKDTAAWTGPAGDAYRKHAHDKIATLRAASTAASTISTVVDMVGAVVDAVRTLVRDIVTQAIGQIVQIALEEVFTLGLATPVVAAQVSTQVAKFSTDIAQAIKKLTSAFAKLKPMMSRLDEIWQAIVKALRGAGRGAREKPAGTTPSGARSPAHGDSAPSSGKPHDGPETGTGPTGQDGGIAGNNRGAQQEGTPAGQKRECGDPIDVASGDVILQQTDVELAGVLPLVLARVHVSSYRVGRCFGPSWASTLDQRLEVDERGIWFAADDGTLLSYPRPGPGSSAMPVAGPRRALFRDEDGHYAVTDADRARTLHFGAGEGALPLLAVTDRNGNRIDFDRDPSGVPTEIRHSGGYRVRVDSEDGRVIALHLRGADNGADLLLVRYEYEDGHLANVVNASGLPLRFTYDHSGRLTSWTDRNGAWYRYHYDHAGRVVRADGSGGFLSGSLAYDDEHRITWWTNSLGQRTEFQLNELGQTVREVDPAGGEVLSEWDEFDRLLARTDALGRRARYDRDEHGNLTAVTRPDGGQTLLEYDEQQLPVTIVAPDGTISRREHDERGNLSRVVDPAGAATTFDYDQHGHLTAVTDAHGTTRDVTTDSAGLPVSITDGAGRATRYERDGFGRLTAVTDPTGGVMRFGWTVDGKPAWRQQPDGAVERWGYDGEGNVRTHVDALGQVTRTEVTHFDLPAAEIRPDGTRLVFGYDTELRLTSVTNEQGLVWRYDYDPAGNLAAETDFNERTVTYRHDAAGQLVERTNGAGETTSFTRNVLGDVIERRTPDGAATFSYDEAGQLVEAMDGDTQVTFQRDPLGRAVSESVNGRAVASTYDALGRRVHRRTPSGAESVWEYDACDQPTALHTAGRTLRFERDPAGREVERWLGPDAVLTQSWDANHQLTSQSLHSAAGQQVARRSYSYRADGMLTGVDDGLTGPRRFDLDRGGRVTGVQGHGWGERYAYDAAGNVVDASWPVGQSSPEAESLGRREYSGTLVQRAGRVTYKHDPQGRVVFCQRKRLSRKPETWRYFWDADDRLIGVLTPDGTNWRYRYDPLGRRTAKQRLSPDGARVVEQVDFTWDGVVLAEQARSGGIADDPQLGDARVTVWDYEPGTFRPLTQTERAPLRHAPQQWIDQRFHSIITDLVGTPTELVNDHGGIDGFHRTGLWGTTSTRGGTASTPLRFPGQYHDPETGLHYNLHRHYDPTTGRYTSTDPLDLAAGPNPHRYVANPHELIDPLGLAPENCKVSRQKQGRHVIDDRNYGGGGYFTSHDEAQHVLDAYHSGEAKVFGETKEGHTLLDYEGVTGYNHNPANGYPNQATNRFMIKGVSRPSVVPVSPTKEL